MRTKKRVFRSFGYLECDAFAEYLKEMAVSGWHFSGWKLGMVFEKGEPKERIYAVEVFPKGKEEDVSPSEDAQEYAIYCEEAGWKFLDARGKFCVFEQLKEDAVPIVTAQEKLEYIKKAEKGKILYGILLAGSFLLLILFRLFTMFSHYIFNGIEIVLLIAYSILFLLFGISGISSIFRCRKYRKQLEKGETPYYGKMFHIGRAGITLFSYGVILYLFIWGIRNDLFSEIQSVLLFGFCLVLIMGQGLRKILRFSREKDAVWNGVLVGVYIFVLLLCTGNALIKGEANPPSLEQFPLLPQDLQKEVSSVEAVDCYRTQSLFGIKEEYWLTYRNQMQQEESLRYAIYSSPYEWVLQRVWTEETESVPMEETPNGWNAKKAASISGIYYICYGQKILRLSVEEPLTKEQIQVVEERLKLKE